MMATVLTEGNTVGVTDLDEFQTEHLSIFRLELLRRAVEIADVIWQDNLTEVQVMTIDNQTNEDGNPMIALSPVGADVAVIVAPRDEDE